MVCVSGGCDGYHPMFAALIGLVSGPSYLGISRLMVELKIDDPVDAVAIHLGGGKRDYVASGVSFKIDLPDLSQDSSASWWRPSSASMAYFTTRRP